MKDFDYNVFTVNDLRANFRRMTVFHRFMPEPLKEWLKKLT